MHLRPRIDLFSRRTRPAKTWLALAVTMVSLAGCGGGGGGGGGSNTPVTAASNVVQVTVVDSFGAPVAGARVQTALGTTTTGAQGVTLVLTDTPGASAQVVVSRDTFVERSTTVTSAPGGLTEVRVTLERQTRPVGGSLTSRSGTPPSVDGSGQVMTFEIELVVLGGNAQALTQLARGDFTLSACTPDATDARSDCVRGDVASDDVPYQPASAAPEALALLPGGPSRPHATALLLDQSGSIEQSDPTGARLYASKAFLGGLGASDQVLLAAFAGGTDARIPSAPMTVYGPFRAQAQATGYFTTLDGLAPLLGGNTPLYESVDALQQQWLGSGARPDGLGKALVVFTDGVDTGCGDPQACRTRRLQSIASAQADQVRIFTVALSRGVDIAALGELGLQSGGALLYAENAAQLLPIYGSIGQLMSLSLPTYRLRWTVRAAAPGAFRSGHSLLGRVQVVTAGGNFEVPFVVGIP